MDYYRQQQVSTISPPLGGRPRGSVAGVRGGLPAYCPLRTAPPPNHQMHEAAVRILRSYHLFRAEKYSDLDTTFRGL